MGDIMVLTDSAVLNSKPGVKAVKLFDGKGLYLLVSPAGGKYWRFKYRFGGKELLLSMGGYPKVSLSDARLLCNEARRLVAAGINPSAVRKAQKARDKAERFAMESKPSVRILLEGSVEIWKGRAVVRLTPDEAQFVKDLLGKLIPRGDLCP